MTNSLLITVYAFANCLLMSFSVDETLLPKLVNLSIREDKMHFFFQVVVVSILEYGCTTRTLTKLIEKKSLIAIA